ncbi:hypothetical protein JXB22_04870 [candidate division WOR-3 bacterium]|nr:hypothetical protein [candidate division WOR-3 bacterium]
MKKLFGIAIAMAALLILVGCDGEVVLDAPDVDYTVDDTGATLALEWVEIADADGYYIYADGVIVDTLEATELAYDATTPAAEYAVSAYAGEDESDLTTIDCAPEVTEGLVIYDMSQPAPDPSGFGFNSSGTAVAYSVSDSTNWALLDFYIENGPQSFWSPHHGGYNAEVNATENSGSTNFDGEDIANAPGNYTTQTDVVSDAVYFFWIDPTNNGWDDATDYFGKIKVQSINGTAITMDLAFQPIAGLRWCVTD